MPEWPVVPAEVVEPKGETRRSWRNMEYQERYRLQRESLLANAQLLAEQSSPDAVKISEIVALSGVSRRTFYEHFDSKEELFAKLIRQQASPLVAALTAAVETALPNGPEAVCRSVVIVFKEGLGERGVRNFVPAGLAFNLWGEGQRDATSPVAGALDYAAGYVSEVLVVAAKRLGSPLDDETLAMAARHQIDGAVGAFGLAAGLGSAVDVDALAQAMAIALGFAPSVISLR